jgi:hypothetical protein
MYTHFTAHVQLVEQKQVFESLSLDLLNDIGDLYVAWESLDVGSKPLSNAKKTNKSLVLTCNHLFRVFNLTDTWTPFSRHAKIAGFLERKWLRILSALKEGAGKELVVLNDLSKRSELRAQIVMKHLEKVVLKDHQTQRAFDAAEAALLDKSFGF